MREMERILGAFVSAESLEVVLKLMPEQTQEKLKQMVLLDQSTEILPQTQQQKAFHWGKREEFQWGMEGKTKLLPAKHRLARECWLG